MTESTMIYDVVLVPFPFSDLSTHKKRPCVVLHRITPTRVPPLVIVAMMTSNLAGVKYPHDITVADLSKAGLPKPTIIRLSKVVTLEEKMILKKLGCLSSKDSANLSKELRRMFARRA